MFFPRFLLVIVVSLIPASLFVGLTGFGRAPNATDDIPPVVELTGRLFSSTSEWQSDDPPTYYLMLPEEDIPENQGDCSYQLLFLTPLKYMAAEQWINKQVTVRGYIIIDQYGIDKDGEAVEPSGCLLTNSIRAKGQ